MNIKIVFSTLVVASVLGAFATPNGTIKDNVYEIEVTSGSVPMNADDVEKLKTPGITEFKKSGAGTLVVESMPSFAGTIRVAGGVYSVPGSVAAPFGTVAGPTIVETGATVKLYRRQGVDDAAHQGLPGRRVSARGAGRYGRRR